MKQQDVLHYKRFIHYANTLGKSFLSHDRKQGYHDKSLFKLARWQLQQAQLNEQLSNIQSKIKVSTIKSQTEWLKTLKNITQCKIDIIKSKLRNKTDESDESDQTSLDTLYRTLNDASRLRTSRMAAFRKDIKESIKKSDSTFDKKDIQSKVNSTIQGIIQELKPSSFDETNLQKEKENLDKNRFESIKTFLSQQEKKEYYQELGYGNKDDFKQQLRLIFAAWEDKTQAQAILADKLDQKDDKAYAALQNKKMISRTERKQIHAGLLILLFSTQKDDEPAVDYFKAFHAMNFKDEEKIKESLPINYKKIQMVLQHFEDTQSFSEKLLTWFYSLMSGTVKGIATCVLLLTFGLIPPTWSAIPLFAAFFCLMNFRYYEPGSGANLFRGMLSSSMFVTLIPLVFLFPAFPWFFVSLFMCFGSIAGLSSYQMVKNIFHEYKKQNNIKSHSLFDSFKYKVINGHSVEMDLKEKGAVICSVILTVLGQALFQFLIYQSCLYFINTIPFLASVAAFSLTPSIVFILIALMQMISCMTTFRFVKYHFIDFVNHANVGELMHHFREYYLSKLHAKPVRTVLKTVYALILSGIAFLYLYFGAKVAATAVLRYFAFPLTSFMWPTFGIAVAIILPIQMFYSWQNNKDLFKKTVSLLKQGILSLKTFFSSAKSKPQEQPTPLNTTLPCESQSAKLEKSLRNQEENTNGLERTKNIVIAILNVFSKAATKIDPHAPWSTIPNAVMELFNALASSLLGIKKAVPDDLHKKDISIIEMLIEAGSDTQFIVTQSDSDSDESRSSSPIDPRTPSQSFLSGNCSRSAFEGNDSGVFSNPKMSLKHDQIMHFP